LRKTFRAGPVFSAMAIADAAAAAYLGMIADIKK
jgi:hypothetical protein